MNLNGGTGVVKGFLIKKVPRTLPTLSLTSLILVTSAIALLDSPIKTVWASILPKNLPCASSASDAVSTFSNVDEAEYAFGIVIAGLYGSFVYVKVGAEKGPTL